MQRHTSSTSSKNEPPISMDAGMSARWSAPTKKRARCGTIRPTQPTMPATATDADVSSVANAMTKSRVARTSMPSDCASSSPSAMTLMRHRSASRPTRPTKNAASRPARSPSRTDDKPPISQNVISGNCEFGSAKNFMPEVNAWNRFPITKPDSTSTSTPPMRRPMTDDSA